MIIPPKGGARRPWLGILALVALVVVLAIRQRSAPNAPPPGSPAATAPASEQVAPREAQPGLDPRAERSPADRDGSNIGFRSRDRWQEHWQKHGREFASLGIRDADAYLAAAQELRDRPAGGRVLEEQRADGVTTRFDRETGAFLAFNRDRTIRTYFRPNDGEAYFHRQANREH